MSPLLEIDTAQAGAYLETAYFGTGNESNTGFSIPLFKDSTGGFLELAQAFTAPATGNVDRVKLLLGKKVSNSTSYTYTLKIVNNSSSLPGNTVLGTTTFSTSTNFGWVEVQFSSSVALTSGTRYWLVLTGTSGQDENLVWYRNNLNSLGESNAFRSQNKGLVAEYYNGGAFNTLVGKMAVADINIPSSDRSFLPYIQNEDVNTTKFKGTITVPHTGTWTFYADSDDGVKLVINATNVINDLTDVITSNPRTGTISLTANTAYSFECQHREGGGVQRINLQYAHASLSQRLVPNSAFIPDSTSWVSNSNYNYCFSVVVKTTDSTNFQSVPQLVNEYRITSKLSNKFFGVNETTLEVDLYNLFTKYISLARGAENWTTSEVMDTTIAEIGGSRKIEVSTTGNITDEYVFNSELNTRKYLNQFNNLTNVVANSNTLPSDDEDFIEIEAYIDDIETFDTSSEIVFISEDEATKLTASFDDGLNNLVEKRWQTIKIKKEAFVVTDGNSLGLTRPGFWQECSYKVQLKIKQATSTQSFYFRNIALTGNIEKYLQPGLPIRVGSYVSEDNGATWYAKTEFIGRTASPDTSSDNIGIRAIDGVGAIKGAFVSSASIFEKGSTITNAPKTSMQILKSIFQEYELLENVNTGVDLGLNVPYYYIDYTSPVGRYVQDLCKAGFLITNYNGDGEVSIKSPVDYLLNREYSLFLDNKIIYSYKQIPNTQELLYNRIIIKGKKHVRRNDTIILDNDAKYPLNKIISRQADTTLIFNGEPGRTGGDLLAQPINNNTLDLSAYKLSNFTGSGGAVVPLIRIEVIDGKIFATFRNPRPAEVKIEELTLTGDGIFHEDDVYYEITDQDSIDKYGERKLEIEADAIQTNGFFYVARTILEQFKQPTNVYEITTQYQPNVELGQIVGFMNAQGREVSGYVMQYVHNFGSDGFTTTFTIKENGKGEGDNVVNISKNADALLNVAYNGHATPEYGMFYNLATGGTFRNIAFYRDTNDRVSQCISNGLSLRVGDIDDDTITASKQQGFVAINPLPGVSKYRISYKVVFLDDGEGTTRTVRVRAYNNDTLLSTLNEKTATYAFDIVTIENTFIATIDTSVASGTYNIRIAASADSIVTSSLIAKECFMRVTKIS